MHVPTMIYFPRIFAFHMHGIQLNFACFPKAELRYYLVALDAVIFEIFVLGGPADS